MKSRGWSLTQLFGVSVCVLFLLLGLLLTLVFNSTQAAILESSDRQRELASLRVADSVEGYLAQADTSIDDLERELRAHALDETNFRSIEAALYSDLLNHDNLTEVTLTYAWDKGFDSDGDIELYPGHRGQVALVRQPEGDGARIVTTELMFDPDKAAFDQRIRERSKGAVFDQPPLADVKPTKPPDDPTQDLTFKTPTNRQFFGRSLWSDLHWSEGDEALPVPQRRVEVTVQKAIANNNGGLLGVVRVGIQTQRLDDISKFKVNDNDPGDPHQVFICDTQGRLITRLSPQDRIEERGDDLRVALATPNPAVEEALRLPILAEVTADMPRAGRFILHGQAYLTTFRYLPKTQDWIVGIVVPEAYYLGTLQVARQRLLVWLSGLGLLLLVGGISTLRWMRKGLHQITDETTRIGKFDFSASNAHGAFVEVDEALSSLAQAKTALRAMGKYVPMDLVRLLYQTRSDPVLGGSLMEISMLFTDIANFTALSEQMTPNETAYFLGLYLEAMTKAVHDAEGNIDKYIGDAIMAVWNAPSPVKEHSLKACRAAVACLAATATLYAGEAWHGRPAWETRFGIHTDTVSVGHFGAPDRMSYTALGDGVNLASRLEGLNKQYGTTVLVSETVYEAAKHVFAFRRMDRVAVKGKTQGILVYELLVEPDRDGLVARYEEALSKYFERDFTAAIALLQPLAADGPSQRLLHRCEQLLLEPPPPDWDGTYIAMSK